MFVLYKLLVATLQKWKLCTCYGHAFLLESPFENSCIYYWWSRSCCVYLESDKDELMKCLTGGKMVQFPCTEVTFIAASHKRSCCDGRQQKVKHFALITLCSLECIKHGQSPTWIIKAFNAVMSGEISVRQTTVELKSLLDDWVSGWFIPGSSSWPPRYLTTAEESELVQCLSRCAAMGYGI